MEPMDLQLAADAVQGKILRGRPGLELTGISTDTRTLKRGELFFALLGDNYDGHHFLPHAVERRAAAAIVNNRNVLSQVPALPLVLVEHTTRALGDLAHWHRQQCPTTVIGITGTNGKTTVKEMLFHILDGVVRSVKSIRNFNNAVGVPLTLFQMRPKDVYLVVEMGTNAAGEIARLCEIADPDIGLVTNVAQAHLEGLGDVQGVAREKAALLRHAARRTAAFYNADDYWSRRIAAGLKGTLCSFGIENQADLRGFNPRSDKTGTSFKAMGGPRIHVPVPGSHTGLNTLAAVAVARRLGIDWGTIADRLATFRLPPLRMQLQTVGGVTVINDAYNANPVSVEAAAKALSRMECSGRRILVLADMLELGAQALKCHRDLGRPIAHFGIDYLLGTGDNTAELLASAAKHGMNEHDLHLAGSNEQLARTLLGLVEQGDTILFKGSRNMHLEQAAELLLKSLGTADQTRGENPIYELYRSEEKTQPPPRHAEVGQSTAVAPGAPAAAASAFARRRTVG